METDLLEITDLSCISSLLRVYPMEGPGTSVELRILPTHLHRGESGSREGGGTEELGRITQLGQREKSDKRMPLHGGAVL